MTAHLRLRRSPSGAIPVAASPWGRVYGLGSIFAKTLRDSRLAFLIASGILAAMMLAAGAAMQDTFPTAAARAEVDALIASIPASMAGLFGNPIRVGTLPGIVNWKYGPFFVLGAGLWAILALSGTLAGEARRGSLDFIAAAPFGKRRIALEKLAAYLTMLGLSMAVLALAAWATAAAFGDAALGDAIPPEAAIGFALWVGLVALAFGALAFALAPLLGRGGAAAVAGVAMMLGWVSNGYEALDVVAVLTPFKWTASQAPIVGVYDWPSLAFTGLVAIVLLAIGVELFARRDLGVTLGITAPRLPGFLLGTGGPAGRALADELPRALAWGVGLGLFGLMIASLTGPMATQIAEDPQFLELFRTLFPSFDPTTPGGLMQLYMQILLVLAGYAGATLVSKWASDETEGRLEMVLTTPLARARWVIAGGLGVLGGVIAMTLLVAAGVALGAGSAEVGTATALTGTASLGIYALAIAGIGIAVGGLWRTSLAAEAAAVVVTATFLLDLLAPPLKAPDWVHRLALTANLGEPMIGSWDANGVIACLAVFVAGVALGAFGIMRRDVHV